MASIAPSQMTFSFEPSLPERFPSLRAYIAHRTPLLHKSAKVIAADMDMSPSTLSRKLNPSEGDTQRFNVDDLEEYIKATGEAPAVIEYPMPESVTDRCTKSHEYIFLLSKSASYYYDHGAIKEPVVSSAADILRARVTGRGEQAASAAYLGAPQRDKSGGFPNIDLDNPTRNKRSVWTVATTPYSGAHFATFPTALIEPCILAGAPAGGIVLDPFFGSGTTGQVAQQLGRQFIGIELNEANEPLQRERLRQPSLNLEAA